MKDRECGPCQLCCRVMPIAETGKLANTRCAHQRFRKGCAIYGEGRPLSCIAWSCGWLLHPEHADLIRPDLAGYVIDPCGDFMTIEWHTRSTPTNIRIIQIWVDPKRPCSHRDPALRAMLEEAFRSLGFIGVARNGTTDALVLFPPEFTMEGWVEHAATPRQPLLRSTA